MRTRWILLFSLLVTASGGCNSPAMVASAMPSMDAQISPSKEPPGTNPREIPTLGIIPPNLPSMPAPLTPDLQNLIEKAKEHLADRLSISTDQINFLEAFDVTWSDSSLGCPQEGMFYAQVLNPGYLIRLEYDANPYEYHSGKGTEITYCANPIQPLPGIPDTY